MKNFLAIDPGERWLGLAGLSNNGTSWNAYAMVVDMKPATVYDTVHALSAMTVNKETTVLCEEYRPRPQGHNRFSKHSTIRLIGALEYAFADQGKTVQYVTPQTFALSEVLFGPRTLREWQERWNQHGSQRWEHSLSAWRILAYHLSRRHQDTVVALHTDSPAGFRLSAVRYGDGWLWQKEKHTAPALIIPLPTTG